MWSDVAQRPAVPAPLATDAPQRKASAVTQGFLQIDRLSKAFVPAKPVFADVSFTLDKGEFVCIIGHSERRQFFGETDDAGPTEGPR